MTGTEKKIADRRKQYTPKSREIYDRAMNHGSRARQSAIRSHCIMCMGFQTHEVFRCTDVACPLYPYREG